MQKIVRDPEEILEGLGLKLGPARKPLGNYVSCVQTGNLIYTSGQISEQYIGQLGKDLTVEEGYLASRQALINLLCILKDELGELSRVKKVVRLFGMVHSASDFIDQPKVVNGASDLLVDIFGEKGKHARSAVGMAQLPKNAAVELELIVEIDQ